MNIAFEHRFAQRGLRESLMIDIENYVSVGEAAKRLGITNVGVCYRIRTGLMKGIDVRGWRYMIPIEEIGNIQENPPKQGRPKTKAERARQAMPEGFVNSMEAAKLLGIGRPIVVKWIKLGYVDKRR